MRSQQVLDHFDRAVQLPFAPRVQREVVHVAQVVRHLRPSLAQRVVERLECGVGEPLAEIRADHHAVAHHALGKVQNAVVLHQLPHPRHHDLRLQAVVEVPDVQLCAPARALRIVSVPLLHGPHAVVDASAADAPAAIRVHAAHHRPLQGLYQSMVDVLVGPQLRLIDVSPLARALVPPPLLSRRCRLKAAHDDRAQCLDAARAVRFYPLHGLVRPVPRPPAVCGVHLVNGISEVLVADKIVK